MSKDECPLSQVVFTKVLDTQGMLQAAICREEAGGHIKWGDTGTLLMETSSISEKENSKKRAI